MTFRIDYSSASGFSLDSFCFLAHRYDPDIGVKRLESESIVVRCETWPNPAGGDPLYSEQILYWTTARLVELWRSASGQLFVADSFGKILHTVLGAPATSVTWDETTVDARLHGVWGLDDDLVFAFGRTNKGSAMFQWEGTRWSPVPAPGFEVEGLHGLSRDSIWAGGAGGKVAHWTGRSWQEFKLPSDETILSVFVAKPGEYYASGNMGTLFEGSDYGWGAIGSIPGALAGDVQAIAKHADKIWVAASRLGLWQREGHSRVFSCLKPNITANNFDTRGTGLVMGASAEIAWTQDGQDFEAAAMGFIEEQRGDLPLGSF